MSDPKRKLIEEASYEGSGETHRIVHVESGRFSFYEIQAHSPGQGSAANPDWSRIGGTHDSLDEARQASKMRDLHVVERRMLPRPDRYYRDGDPSAPRTRWGRSQNVQAYAEGVESHGTAGHGGFKLDRKRNAKVDPAWRADGGWYEEDNEWAIVAHTFPDLFTTYERELADRMLKNGYPDQYTQVTGKTVDPSESQTLRERIFNEENKDKWVVVAASTSKEDRSICVCKATLGGKRPGWGEKWDDRTFLVPTAEYETRSGFGFVIDLERHEEQMENVPKPGM